MKVNGIMGAGIVHTNAISDDTGAVSNPK